MTVIINGTTGIDTVQDGIITVNKIASGAVTDAKINTVATTKLTGVLPDANAPSGSVIQVVSTTKTDTYSLASTTFTDVTGLSVSITPTNASNKIMILINVNVGGTSNNYTIATRITRNGTAIGVGTPAGTRFSATASTRSTASGAWTSSLGGNFLDSPSTTSAITYSVQVAAEAGGTVYVNRSEGDGDGSVNARTISSITVMEIVG